MDLFLYPIEEAEGPFRIVNKQNNILTIDDSKFRVLKIKINKNVKKEYTIHDTVYIIRKRSRIFNRSLGIKSIIKF